MSVVMSLHLLKCFAACLLVALTAPQESGHLLAGTDVVSTVLITEVRYDPGVGEQGGEWVELANLIQGSADLSGFKIGDTATPLSGAGMFRFPEGTLLWPGQVVVVARRPAEYEAQYGLLPDFELENTLSLVADLQPYAGWARGGLVLGEDGDEVVLLDLQDKLVDALAYGAGGSTPGFQGPRIPLTPPGYSLERQPAYCDTDTAADWRARPDPQAGSIAMDGACTKLAPKNGLLPIGDIQGAADESPYVNQWVQFRGVVAGMLEDQNTRGARFYTVFLQDTPGADDGRPLTSDAIAVFLGPNRPQVEVGDLVRVSGQVQEYFGLTEIGFRGLSLAVEGRGQPLPDPVDLGTLEPSLAEVYDLEWLESMRVSLDRGLVVGPAHSARGLAVVPAELARASEPPIFQPRGMLPLNVLSPSDVDCSAWFQANLGDTLSALSGPLTFHFGQSKIVDQLAAAGRHQRLPFSPELPLAPAASDQWRVATLNAADAFDSVDEPGVDDVVQSAEELAVKLTKLAQAVYNLALSNPAGAPRSREHVNP